MLDDGFTPAPDEIRKQETLGITAAFLWGVVYRFCNMSRGVCDASHQTIADEAGMSKRSVDTYIPKLVEAGYLIDRTPDIKHKPHTYDAMPAAIRLGIGKPKDPGVQILHTSEDGMQEMHTESEKSPEGVQNLPNRYAKNADPGVQNLQPIETKITKQKDKKPLSKDKGGKPPKRQPTEKQKKSQMMFSALANLCGFEIKLITDDTRGKLNQAEKKMRENGLTPKDIQNFENWWYSNDWRGQKGQPPTLTQIRETWGQFIRGNKNGATNATYQNGAKQNKRKPGTKPEIDHEQFKKQLQNL